MAFVAGFGAAGLVSLQRRARLVASPGSPVVVSPDAAKELRPGERAAGERLLAATDTCLLDVRDRGLTYETSPTCQQLAEFARAYIAAVDANTNKIFPADDACVFTRAERTAWTALATSAAGGRRLSIW